MNLRLYRSAIGLEVYLRKEDWVHGLVPECVPTEEGLERRRVALLWLHTFCDHMAFGSVLLYTIYFTPKSCLTHFRPKQRFTWNQKHQKHQNTPIALYYPKSRTYSGLSNLSEMLPLAFSPHFRFRQHSPTAPPIVFYSQLSYTSLCMSYPSRFTLNCGQIAVRNRKPVVTTPVPASRIVTTRVLHPYIKAQFPTKTICSNYTPIPTTSPKHAQWHLLHGTGPGPRPCCC